MAVAPLFLFPFCDSRSLAASLLWLCLAAALWLVLSPSLLGGEMLDDARRRVLSGMARDPLFWVLAAVLAVTGFRALNAGIDVFFDYETAEWSVLPPSVSFLPGSFGMSGHLPFVAALSASIVVLGCRHALGKSARMMFILLLAAFSGIAAFVALVLLGSGDGAVAAAVAASPERLSSPGVGFAICFLCSAAALFAVLEQDWGRSALLLVVATAGNGAASFVFLSPCDAVAFAASYVVIMVFSGLCAWGCLCGARGFKALLVILFSIVLSCAIVDAAMPDDALDGKLAAYSPETSGTKEESVDVRGVLSDVACKVWSEHPWTGVGVGAFRFYPRFNLRQDEMSSLPGRVLAVPNGWWQLLVERGMVGAVMLALALSFLVFSYLRGAFRCVQAGAVPDSAAVLAPLALAAVAFSALHSASMLRIEVLTLTGATMVISAKSFPKGDSNG